MSGAADTLHLAYVADRAMRVPVCASAANALAYLRPSASLHVHVLAVGWRDADRRRLERVLARTGRAFEVSFYAPDLASWRHLRPHLGAHAPYLLFDLPDVVDRPRVLYLDADTLPFIDLAALLDVDLQGRAVGAVGWDPVWKALEGGFLATLGLPRETLTLNSGVLLIDVHRWREQDIRRRARELAAQHGDGVVAGDQALLNGVVQGDFTLLPPVFNVRAGHWGQRYQPGRHVPLVLHFVGTPKPWSLLGAVRHGNAPVWRRCAARWGLARVNPAPGAAMRRLASRLLGEGR